MDSAFSFIGVWGHAMAAALYVALAIWVSRKREGRIEQHLLVAALALTACWALYVSFEGASNPVAGFAESLRNMAWLGFMFVLLKRGRGSRTEQPIAVTAIYVVLGLLLVTQTGVDMLDGIFGDSPRLAEAITATSLVLRMMVAIGALVLVHNLYTMSAPQARWGIRLPLAALAAMWTYDLNLFTFAYLAQGQAAELLAMRGVIMALLVPVLALGAERNAQWRLQLSRSLTFQSLSLVAIGGYLVAMVLVATIAEMFAGPFARMVQISFVFGMSVAALVLLPSAKFRSWVRVKVSKHLFQHRYDYRTEWMRFTDTIGRPGDGAAPLHERVIQAVADITDSPSGLLLLSDDSGSLSLQSRWNWPHPDVPAMAMSASQAEALARTGWIIELDAERVAEPDRHAGNMPSWMLEETSAWVLVPLIHFDRLAGAILLARPRVDRRPDWEDFDMLRVIGRQVASYISEAQGQQALSDAQRFDEFNRRFAFIMHDIKNLVSQLTLLARNAERHANNPEFRADMIITLRESAGRMNDLLARLSQHNKGKGDDPRPVALRPIIEVVTRVKRRSHPVEVHLNDTPGTLALADAARVEQILMHLVQNAIDASAPGAPVTVALAEHSDTVTIDVTDKGCGMSAEFVRRDLFTPFVSSKAGGFGIGAFEARALAVSMGGRIEVESREGIGSRFTLELPKATHMRMPHVIEERAA